jgi:uncharacterized protein YlxP (DUF503 family)
MSRSSRATFGILSAEIHLPSSRSLKDKRRVVKSLIERLHQKYRLSIAETGFNDLHQRAEISLAVVATGEAEIERMFDEIRDVVESDPEIYLTRYEPQILEGGS